MPNIQDQIDRLNRLYGRTLLEGDKKGAQAILSLKDSYESLMKYNSNQVDALRILSSVIARCQRSSNSQLNELGIHLSFLRLTLLNSKEFAMLRDHTKKGSGISRVQNPRLFVSSEKPAVIREISVDNRKEEDKVPLDRGVGEPQGDPAPPIAQEEGVQEHQDKPQEDTASTSAPEPLESGSVEQPKVDVDELIAKAKEMSYPDLKVYAKDSLFLNFAHNISQSKLLDLVVADLETRRAF